MKQLLITIAAVVLVGCGPSISIHKSVEEGNIEAVKQHLAAETDVNAKAEDGHTPLHIAAVNGKKEIAELLIDKGADVNAKYDGWTPLHDAASYGHKEIAELLITNGADVNAKDIIGFTPLQFAQTKEIAELLITNGADVNAKDKYGRTPLHDRAFNVSKEIAELLIANGADVNAKNDLGRTPLHNAAWRVQMEIAELLIANGADVNAKADGETPLDLAIEDNPPEIADLLRKHGGKTGEELKAEGK